MIRILVFCSLVFLMFSCSEDYQGLYDESYMKIRKIIRTSFDNGTISREETIHYKYEKVSDFFWSKAVFLDNNMDTTKVIERQLDSTSRLPLIEKEFIDQKLIKSRRVKYSMKSYLQKHLEEFNAKNQLCRKTQWIYNDGFLSSVIDTQFKLDFTNIDSNNILKTYKINNFFPNKSIPQGNFKPHYYYEYLKEYNLSDVSSTIGTLKHEIITNFDDNGFPEYHFNSAVDEGEYDIEAWYKTEIDDDGRIIKLLSYANKNLDSISMNSSETLFEYNSEGLIEAIEEYRYNEENAEFSNFYKMNLFDWVPPKFECRYNYTDYNFTEEIYSYTKHIHSISEKKIVRWDDVGLKVVEEFSDFYEGEYDSLDFNPKPMKRTTYVFDVLEKKGDKVLYLKNKNH